MFFNSALYVSLAIFGIGMLYKISTWFWRSIGIDVSHISTSERVLAAIKGILQTVCSAKILTLFKAFFVDVILQIRVLKENFLRWLMHMLIYGGFILLLLFHALDNFITQPLFPDYAPTLNPFMFLRDLLGLLVIIGIGIAIYRRIVMKIPRLKTNAMDRYAVIILAIIMLSGILLEGVKITSYSRYKAMVEEYADTDDEEELKALESFWVKEYHVVSPNIKGPFDEDILTQGAEIHDMSCGACHSRPGWAFTGFAVAEVTKPLAGTMDRAHVMDILWYIHFLACFLGLAYLPFSKMFHIFASPVSLLVNAVMDKESANRANIATRQVMELDACTHCGTCSRRCSVAVAFHKFGNMTILPSEKMVFLKKYIANKDIDGTALKTIQLGAYLCTNCDRCTVVCPVGINLRDLWFNVKEEVIQKDQPLPLVLTPYSFYRGVDGQTLDPEKYPIPLNGARRAVADRCELISAPDKVLTLTPVNKAFKEQVVLSSQGDTYSYCFSCENCTTVCPVVQNYENPEEVLSLLPHQIMRSLGLGLKDLALGSNMIWDCLTCYQCQEHCPQGVKVTDILYELKNIAAREILPELGVGE